MALPTRRNAKFSALRRGGGGRAAADGSVSQMSPVVRYSAVPVMELRPPPPVPHSRTNSETSGSERSGERPGLRREERRRSRLNSELLTAVLEGNLAVVDRCLASGASVDATCRRSRTTALQLAVVCGHEDISRRLINMEASVCTRDRAGRQAIHFAAASGQLGILVLLLGKDSSLVNCPVAAGRVEPLETDHLDSWSHNHDAVADKIPDMSDGATPLHLATQRLHLDCVAELLKAGARVDIADGRGLTPLDCVGEIPHAPSTDFPGDNDVTPSTSDETLNRIKNMRERISGYPLPMKSRIRIASDDKPNNWFENIELPDSSSTRIIQPDAFRRADPTILITPSSPSKTGPSLAHQVVSKLIDKGAKMSKSKVIVKQNGVHNQVAVPMTCLHTAVERADLQLIEFLVDNGACQLSWNKDGMTPLHLAVTHRLLEPLRLLLEKNKTSQVVDSRDKHGQTPLHVAVAQEWFAGVSLLLEAGADVKVTSNDSQTVLHVAAPLPESQLLEELLTIPESVKIIDSRNSQHETPLCCAVIAGRLPCAILLLSRGADITTSLPGDVTLLHLAAQSGNTAVLKTLLDDSRTVTCKNTRSKETKGGVTPLHLAALGGHVDCVKVLISAGCDVCAVSSESPHYGSTALHLAALMGHCNVVELIVKHNRNTLCVQNVHGWYPLHVAARFAKKDCARFMLLNGANLAATVLDSGGYRKTALDIIVYSILHPVHFLERIMDCCIEVNDYPLNNPKCVVKVNYDLLQPLGPHRKQLKVLDSLLNCGKFTVQEKLLLHPLIETFLYLKWKRLRVFFFLMMALYIVFTVSLTTMAMFFYVLKTQSLLVDTCISTCRLTLCVSLTIITLQELLQAARMQKYYFKDLESWIKWAAYILATIVVVSGHPAEWLVHVSAVAVLLSWLELLFLLSRWPSSLGFYILMFFTVAKNVLRVLAAFTFVILGFTFAFMIHFQARVPFDNWWDALVKVMVMTLEFDYGSMYEGANGVDATSIVGRSIFLSFMVLVAIVLMNLLVGLAVSDIATLEKQGRAQRLAKQIDFLSLLEMFVYNRTLFYTCCPGKVSEAVMRCRAAEPSLIIEPGKPFRKTNNFLPQQLRQSVISNIINKKKNIDEDSCDEEGDSTSKSAPSKPLYNESSDEQQKQIISQAENQMGQPIKDIKESLESIMHELTLIKKDIASMKTREDLKSSV